MAGTDASADTLKLTDPVWRGREAYLRLTEWVRIAQEEAVRARS
jgi:hypothetical protein